MDQIRWLAVAALGAALIALGCGGESSGSRVYVGSFTGATGTGSLTLAVEADGALFGVFAHDALTAAGGVEGDWNAGDGGVTAELGPADQRTGSLRGWLDEEGGTGDWSWQDDELADDGFWSVVRSSDAVQEYDCSFGGDAAGTAGLTRIGELVVGSYRLDAEQHGVLEGAIQGQALAGVYYQHDDTTLVSGNLTGELAGGELDGAWASSDGSAQGSFHCTRD